MIGSRAIDESGYIQPSREALIEARGTNSGYHYNGIKLWKAHADGTVVVVSGPPCPFSGLLVLVAPLIGAVVDGAPVSGAVVDGPPVGCALVSTHGSLRRCGTRRHPRARVSLSLPETRPASFIDGRCGLAGDPVRGRSAS